LLISKPDPGSFIHRAQRLVLLVKRRAVFRVRGGKHAEATKANAGTGVALLRHAALPTESQA